MPITADNVEKAEAWLKANGDNPTGTVSLEKYDQVTTNVERFRREQDQANNTSDTGGKVDDSKLAGGTPVRWKPEKTPAQLTMQQATGTTGIGYGRGGQFGVGFDPGNPSTLEEPDEIFFEPSLDKAKAALSDPNNMAALGYDEAFTPQALENITEESEEYQKYADNQWEKSLLAAKEKGTRGIARYSKIGFGDDPSGVTRAAAAEYAVPFASGVDDSVLLGAGKAVAESINPGSTEFVDDLNKKHWITNMAGNAAGYLAPSGAGNLLTKGATKAVGYAGAKAAAEQSGKVLTKQMLARGAAAGGIGATAELAGQDIIQAAENVATGNDIVEGDAGDYFKRYGAAAVLGTAGGAAGEGLGALLAKGSKSISEDPLISNDLKLLREGGGDTAFFSMHGVKPTEAVEDNVFRATRPGPGGSITGTPEDIAAKKVSSKIQDSLQSEEKNLVSKIETSLNKYYDSKEGIVKHSVAPLVNSMSDAIASRLRKTDLGDIVNTETNVTRQFRDRIKELSSRKVVSAQEARDLVEKNPGWRSYSMDDAEKIWPSGQKQPGMKPGESAFDYINRTGMKPQDTANQRVIFIPLNVDSRQLEQAGRHIDDLMVDPKNQGGEKQALVMAQKGLKEMRRHWKPNSHTPGSATLDDGTVVTGLGALQRSHHEARNALETAQRDVGYFKRNRPDEIVKRYQMPGTHTDVSQSVRDAAEKAGVLHLLEDSAATGAYQRLRGKSSFEQGGIRQTILKQLMLRGDPIMRAIADVPSLPRKSSGQLNDIVGMDLQSLTNMQPSLYKLRGGKGGRAAGLYSDRQKEKKE
jgi:hypothetical protein